MRGFRFLLILAILGLVQASPIHLELQRRQIIKPINGNVTIFDPTSQQRVPQGRPSDGGGVDFSAPAVLWIAFCAIVGTPLSIAGVRGWKLTSGVGIGLSMAILGTSTTSVHLRVNCGSPKLTPLLLSLAYVTYSLGSIRQYNVPARTRPLPEHLGPHPHHRRLRVISHRCGPRIPQIRNCRDRRVPAERLWWRCDVASHRPLATRSPHSRLRCQLCYSWCLLSRWTRVGVDETAAWCGMFGHWDTNPTLFKLLPSFC